MLDERLSQGTSFWHRSDPRAKLLLAVAGSVLIATTHSLPLAVLALPLALLPVLTARLPLTVVLRRLLPVNGFVLLLWLLVPWSAPGTAVAQVGPLQITAEGLQLMALITCKTNAIVLLLIGLLATSSIAALGHALQALGCPRKFCFLLLFSYRYLGVIQAEFQRLARAARLRNHRPRANLHSYRTFGYLVAMTLVKSYERSRRVQQAMALRGFDGVLRPLALLRWSPSDSFILLGGSILLGALWAVTL